MHNRIWIRGDNRPPTAWKIMAQANVDMIMFRFFEGYGVLPEDIKYTIVGRKRTASATLDTGEKVVLTHYQPHMIYDIAIRYTGGNQVEIRTQWHYRKMVVRRTQVDNYWFHKFMDLCGEMVMTKKVALAVIQDGQGIAFHRLAPKES